MFPLLFVLHPVPKHNVWRWAIYRVDEATMLANPRSGAINAGTERTKASADAIGQQSLYSILSFGSLLNLNMPVTPLTYDVDLVPDIDVAPLMAHLVGDASQVLQMGV